MNERAQILRIRGHGVLVLTIGAESDFPWFVGGSRPLEAYRAYERFFGPLEGEGSTERWLRFDLLELDGISSSEVQVQDDLEEQDDPSFLHALKLADNGTASWRIGFTPLADDDVTD